MHYPISKALSVAYIPTASSNGFAFLNIVRAMRRENGVSLESVEMGNCWREWVRKGREAKSRS